MTCVGVVTLDALALVDRYPGEDERVTAREIRFAGGGPAATAAVVLARQGVPVAFVGRVGVDEAGDQAVHQLAAEGVDVSGILRDPAVPTQASCIVVAKSSQSRAISTLRVPAWSDLGSPGAELVAASEWVHVDHLGFAPVSAQLRRMADRPKLALDAGNPVAGLDLSLVDLFVPTVESLCAVTEVPVTAVDRAAAHVLRAGTRSVVATDGADGSYAWWSAESPVDAGVEPAPGRVFVRAETGIDIVSTLGAGDVFHGGLLAALCRDETWEAALRSANATAALSCRALDGRTAIPPLAELAEYLTLTTAPAV